MANIRKRGNSYQIRVSVGYDTNGNQVVRTKTWKPSAGMTERQIENELRKQVVIFEEKCLRGMLTSNIKFEELSEHWFEEYAKTNLKRTTLKMMRMLTSRVYPVFGHMRIDKITHHHIQAFIDDLAKNGKNKRTDEPLSVKTLIHHLNFLSDIFNYAVRLEIISDSPCKNIMLPKRDKKEKSIYTIEEIEQLLKMLETQPIKYRAFFTLAIYSGFRRGELLGLEWKDIDWENEVISVRRTSNYSKGVGYYTDTPKTKKSIRSLKLPTVVFDVLRLLQQENNTRKHELGSKWVENDRLFVQQNGKPMSTHTAYDWLKRFCDKNDFRFCDIHSMRHFNASCLINAGVDAAAVSAALGHSTISTTTNIYTHVFSDARARTCDAIASALDFSKKDDVTPTDSKS